MAGHAAVLFVLFPNYDSDQAALIVALISVAVGLPLAFGTWSFFLTAKLEEATPDHLAYVALVGYVGSGVALMVAVGALLFELGGPWLTVLYLWPFLILVWAANPNGRLGRRVRRLAHRYFHEEEG